MSIALIPADLAPGDQQSREFDFGDFTITPVRSTSDLAFRTAYERLRDEFGPKNEIETAAVLEKRFSFDPARPMGGVSLLYQMLLVEHNGTFAAARDHTAMVSRAGGTAVTVHLSHLLIDKAFRKTGLSGWMRAFPLQAARAAMEAAGAADAPITLVGEMELPHAAHPERLIRLRAYEKAGFLKIDPAAAPYLQPDFRDADAIDLTGGPQPLPMALIIRRVGREQERTIASRDVRQIVRALYTMYGQAFRPADMKPCWAAYDAIPDDDLPIALLRPTE